MYARRVRTLTRLLLVLFIFTVGTFVFFIFIRRPQRIDAPQIVSTQSTQVVDANEPEVKNIHSPDGKMNISMEKTQEEGDKAVYNFYVSEIEGKDETLLFSKTQSSTSVMGLSPNAWSPDNKYVFVSEISDNKPNYFVFRADGQDFSDGRKYISVVPIFNEKETGNILTDVTGWDSSSLLHVFTIKPSGEKGPSYWFEIPSGWIAALSHR